MKSSKKKTIFIFLIVILVIIGLVFLTYKILNDENKLTVEEKEWITQNINVVQSINIPNNLDVFGKNGAGVFFDFIASFENEYGIEVNEITYSLGEEAGDNAFKIVYEPEESDVIFHEEHYVIISKDKVNISSLSQINNKKVGLLSKDEKIITKYLHGISNTIINTYETSTNLFQALETNTDIEFAIVPLEENLPSILTSNYYKDYHISDLNK